MSLKIKLLCSILVAGLVTGCSTKQDVVVDGANGSNANQTKNIDDRLSSIGSNGISSETIVESGDNMSSSSFSTNKEYNEVTSTLGNSEVVMRSIHFGFDVYTLNGENQQVSSQNAQKINDLSKEYNGFKVKLEGNCDEWGTDEYNYALGLKRATTVKKDLIKNGVSSDRIVTVSFGESNPVCSEKTASCWKKNRRVDYRLLP